MDLGALAMAQIGSSCGMIWLNIMVVGEKGLRKTYRFYIGSLKGDYLYLVPPMFGNSHMMGQGSYYSRLQKVFSMGSYKRAWV